ncbi:MAG: GGDEF domain-containing protein [Dehalococcoidia bacterium]
MTEVSPRIDEAGIRGSSPAQIDLEHIELEAEAELRRTRRTLYVSLVLGVGVWIVLVVWAVFAPRMSEGAHIVFGILVGTEATALGFLLAAYFHVTQTRVLERSQGQLRELAQHLQDTSDRDSLTGLYNHGYLVRRLEEEISLAGRHGLPLSIIILDLNEFKAVNDGHGHLVGDEVLRQIAGAIRQQVRRHDVVARYGGDEFCLVLPETEFSGARKVVGKLRAAMDELAEPLAKWTAGPISFGVGVATYGAHGSTAHELIAFADDRLYREKQAKRLRQAQTDDGASDSGRRTAGVAATSH